MPNDLTPLLKARFEPGSAVNDSEIQQFETFLPRGAGETNAAYAQRLSAAGFARITTSESMRDLSAFRALTQEARVQGIPILILTQEVTNPGESERSIQAVDDLLDRATGQVKEAIVDASGEAGADRNDPYHAATKAATKAGDPGHVAEAKDVWDGTERRA